MVDGFPTQLVAPDDFSVAARSLVDMSHLQETVVWLVNQVFTSYTATVLYLSVLDLQSRCSLRSVRRGNASSQPPFEPQLGQIRLLVDEQTVLFSDNTAWPHFYSNLNPCRFAVASSPG